MVTKRSLMSSRVARRRPPRRPIASSSSRILRPAPEPSSTSSSARVRLEQLVGVGRQEAFLGPGRVVLRQPGDGLEELAAAVVVEVGAGDPGRVVGERDAHGLGVPPSVPSTAASRSILTRGPAAHAVLSGLASHIPSSSPSTPAGENPSHPSVLPMPAAPLVQSGGIRGRAAHVVVRAPGEGSGRRRAETCRDRDPASLPGPGDRGDTAEQSDGR